MTKIVLIGAGSASFGIDSSSLYKAACPFITMSALCSTQWHVRYIGEGYRIRKTTFVRYSDFHDMHADMEVM